MSLLQDYLIEGIVFKKKDAVRCGADYEDDPNNIFILKFSKLCTLDEFKQIVAEMTIE